MEAQKKYVKPFTEVDITAHEAKVGSKRNLQLIEIQDDDITYFQFARKNNREVGPVVVGLELKNKNDLAPIQSKMTQKGFEFQYLNDKKELFAQIIAYPTKHSTASIKTIFFLAHTTPFTHYPSRCTLYLFLVFFKNQKKDAATSGRF